MPKGSGMARKDLDRVTRLADLRVRVEEDLHKAIVAAHRSGETLRDIGEAAGMSHQRVWQIVNEARGPR